jgi:hypothetical protein
VRDWRKWRELTRIGAGESAYMYVENIRENWDFEAEFYRIRFGLSIDGREMQAGLTFEIILAY